MYPEWLLERRKRAERALTSVVATCYLLGVSTGRMDKLVQALGVTGLSKSQVSEMAKDLDVHVEQFRTRRLADAGPLTFLAADALVLKVREGGHVPCMCSSRPVSTPTGTGRSLGCRSPLARTAPAGWRSSASDLVCHGRHGVSKQQANPGRKGVDEGSAQGGAGDCYQRPTLFGHPGGVDPAESAPAGADDIEGRQRMTLGHHVNPQASQKSDSLWRQEDAGTGRLPLR